MPLDPSIPLSGRPAPIEPPMQMLGQFMAFKNAQQEQQIRQRQMQAYDLENQARQRDLQDQEFLQKANGIARGNPDILLQLAAGKVTPKTFQTLNNQMLDAKQKTLALDEGAYKQWKQHNDILGSDGQSILAAPSEERPSLYQTLLSRHINEGRIKPGQVPDAYPGDDTMRQWVGTALGTQGLLDWTEKQRAEARATEQHDAQMKKSAEDLEDKQRRDASNYLGQAGSLQDWMDRASHLHDEGEGMSNIVNKMPQPQFTADEWEKNAPQFRKATLQAAMTPNEIATSEATAENRANVNAHQKTMEELERERVELARKRLEAAANRTSRLTPGQFMVEQRAVEALETGTATRPGLNSRRLRLGAALKQNTDEQGNELTPQTRVLLQAQYDADTAALQETQYRKARLYEREAPNPLDMRNARNGDLLTGPDGSQWRKSGAVTFYIGPGKKPAAAPVSQEPAAPTEYRTDDQGRVIRYSTAQGAWVDGKTGAPLD